MGQLEITTTPGTGAVAIISNEAGAVLHRHLYGSVDAALFGGLGYASRFFIDVDGVVVDGDELSRVDVAESCWSYIDGIPGAVDPKNVRVCLEIEGLLYT